MALLTPRDLAIDVLGAAGYASPLRDTNKCIEDADGVVVGSSSREVESYAARGEVAPAFELAGARQRLFFDPAKLSCGIVTCGGLCPGENDVIRSLVLMLTYGYGVKRILGFRYGYAGLTASPPREAMALTPEVVDSLHGRAGTLLASSRGQQDVGEMVDTLSRLGVGILFTIGGDGTLRGAAAIADEVARRRLAIAIVGVPKTIDNDLSWIDQSFGFATAVDEARRAVAAANIEATGAWNGIGLVKVMGRHSGFIAAHACLTNPDVNFCLVPEVPFELSGEHGLLRAMEQRLSARRHAVIVVAEGAGQDLLDHEGPSERDASGNLKLGDVGVFLRERLLSHFGQQKEEVNIKYIDPSYMVRGGPANASDSELCLRLGQHAVHAGMTGRTRLLVGSWHGHFTHVPLALATATRRRIDPEGALWQSVLEATGQPMLMPEA